MNLTIAEINEFLRLPPDANDPIVAELGDAAVALVQQYLRRDMQADFPTAWPSPCKVAALIICSELYDDRGASFDANGAAGLPMKVRALLAPYRVFS